MILAAIYNITHIHVLILSYMLHCSIYMHDTKCKPLCVILHLLNVTLYILLQWNTYINARTHHTHIHIHIRFPISNTCPKIKYELCTFNGLCKHSIVYCFHSGKIRKPDMGRVFFVHFHPKHFCYIIYNMHSDIFVGCAALFTNSFVLHKSRSLLVEYHLCAILNSIFDVSI